MTELVDQATIESNKKSPYQWKEYTSEEFCDAVTERLTTKAKKLRTNAQAITKRRYSRLIVIIHTDEPALTPEFCGLALSHLKPLQFDLITGAHILFSCARKKHINDEEAEFCRVIPVLIRQLVI